MPPISWTSKWRWPSVEALAVGELLAEIGGARFQLIVRQRGDLRLQCVDGVDPGLISLDPPVVGGTEKLAGERADHGRFLSLRFGVAAMT
jgi:hypothetical protein